MNGTGSFFIGSAFRIHAVSVRVKFHPAAFSQRKIGKVFHSSVSKRDLRFPTGADLAPLVLLERQRDRRSIRPIASIQDLVAPIILFPASRADLEGNDILPKSVAEIDRVRSLGVIVIDWLRIGRFALFRTALRLGRS